VRRFAVLPLLVCFLALGTRAAAFLHDLEHQQRDAVLVNAGVLPPAQQPIHNDSNCRIHAQLHMPMLAAAWVPLLVCVGLFVAFLTLLPARLLPQSRGLAFNCRGPPRF
jgi:hypothetical protein